MNLWLIIPAKSFNRSKSRLAGVLHQHERAALSRKLLTHIIHAGQRAKVCAQIAVTSRDPAVLAHAAALGTQVVHERQPTTADATNAAHTALSTEGDPRLEPSLNRALDQARGVAVANGADAILILPADLPYIQPTDIVELHAAAAAGAQVVIAPSPDGGTNGLLLHPPNALEFAFGRQSFQRHLQQAQTAQLPYRIVQSERLAFDLDQPQDLVRWQTQQTGIAYTEDLCTACP